MTNALSDESLQFPADTPAILLSRCRYANHRTDPWFAPSPRHERAHKRLSVDPVCLGAAMPARNRDRGWVNNVALDPFRDQGAVNPEPVQSGFLDHDHRNNLTGPALDIALQIREPLQQPRHIPAAYLVSRHLGAHGRSKGGHQPERPAEFQRNENCAALNGRNRMRGGLSGSLHGNDLHRESGRPIFPELRVPVSSSWNLDVGRRHQTHRVPERLEFA